MSGPIDGDSSGRVDPLGLAWHERYATHRQRKWGFQWDTRTPPHQVGSIFQCHFDTHNSLETTGLSSQTNIDLKFIK